MKIIFLSKSNNIRLDAETRRDRIWNAWGKEAHETGEFFFVVGGGTEVVFDSMTRIITTPGTDVYDPPPGGGKGSVMYYKLQHAWRWLLENRDFDWLFLCDDDVFINVKSIVKNTPDTYDYQPCDATWDSASTGNYGGAGFWFNRRALKYLLTYDNKEAKCEIDDLAMGHCLMNRQGDNSGEFKDHPIAHTADAFRNQPYFWPADGADTIHYMLGKRQEFMSDIHKSLETDNRTYRRCAMWVGLTDAEKLMDDVPEHFQTEIDNHTGEDADYDAYMNAYVSQQSYAKKNGFVMDKGGWEYHGAFQGSISTCGNLEKYIPYAANTYDMFLINWLAMTEQGEGMFGNWPGCPEPNWSYFESFIDKIFRSALHDKRMLFYAVRSDENNTNANVQIPDYEIDHELCDVLDLNHQHIGTTFNIWRPKDVSIEDVREFVSNNPSKWADKYATS